LKEKYTNNNGLTILAKNQFKKIFIKIHMYNILCLIISNDHLPHYENNKKVWQTYMDNFENIDCYFIEYINDETKIYPFIENNTFYLKGEESYSNIITKTLDSIEYFLHQFSFNVPQEGAEMNGLERLLCASSMRKGVKKEKKYDFIVRTNLSTVVDFNKLQIYLNTIEPYNIYAGQIGPYYNLTTLHFWFYFVGGYGIIMSNDICNILIKNRNITESFKNMDDIDIGYTMHLLNIQPIRIEPCFINCLEDFETKKNNIENKEFIFYRVRQTTQFDRENNEYKIMKDIIEIIYK